MDTDIVADTFDRSQAAVAARIEEVLGAVLAKGVDRLKSYHVAGPEFTESDDAEPLDRQDAGTSARPEAEQFTAVKNRHARFDGLTIVVFGPVANATGVYVRD